MTVGEAFAWGVAVGIVLRSLAGWRWRAKARHGLIPGRMLAEALQMREGKEDAR